MKVYFNKTKVCFSEGCWLDDPHSHINESKKMWVSNGDAQKVAMAESISTGPAKLAVHLLTVLFKRTSGSW